MGVVKTLLGPSPAIASNAGRGEQAEPSRRAGHARPGDLPRKIANRGVIEVKVGGGPRTDTQLLALIGLIERRQAEIAAIQDLGGSFRIPIVVMEAGDESRLARGHAWDNEHGTAPANSPPEAADLQAEVGSLLDFGARLVDEFQRRGPEFMREVSGNVIVANHLQKSIGTLGPDSPRLPIHTAALTRSQIGNEAHRNLLDQVFGAVERHPFLKVFMQVDKEVKAIDLSEPTRPLVAKGRNEVRADTVSLNTGARLVPPEVKPGVEKYLFSKAMDSGALKAFLDGLGLLGADGLLQPGVRLAIGGTGLSAVEARTQLEPMLASVVPSADPLGVEIAATACERLAGALTFVSRSAGQWIAPRHAHGPAWTQQTDFPGRIEEQHALFLHGQGEEVLKAWARIGDAAVALATGSTPSGLRRKWTTQEVVGQQLEDSRRSARALQAARQDRGDSTDPLLPAARTRHGAERQVALSAALLGGGARDPEEAGRQLAAKAPLSFAGRQGYPIYRALVKSITEPGTPVARDNAGLMARLGEWMNHVTASPLWLHAPAAMLFESGIARHVAASYGDLECSHRPGSKPLVLRRGDETHEFDAAIVAPLFSPEADAMRTSLAAQLANTASSTRDDGNLRANFKVGDNRRLVGRDGTFSNVRDHSVRSKGWVDPGTGSTLNAFSEDQNNRDSAVDLACRMAYEQLAQAVLAAAGMADPVDQVRRMQQEHAPDRSAFRKEAMTFEPHYVDAMRRAAFIDAADRASKGEGAVFERLMEVAVADDLCAMEAALQRFGELERFQAACAGIAPFAPPDAETYGQRFPDLPLQVHAEVLGKAFAEASRRLS